MKFQFSVLPILLATFTLGSLSVVTSFSLSSCNLKSGVDKEEQVFNDLFFELERKYSRDFSKEGYALEFAIERPKTVVVKVSYIPGSSKEGLAIDVGEAATRFVSSLARNKYQIEGVETKLVKIPVKKQ